PPSVSPGVASLLTFVIVSAVAVGAVLYSGRTQPPKTKPTSGTAAIAAIRSIAVLPPRSLSRDEESLPLSLGVADALITRLGSVQRLSVRPTSAVMRYVDENHD